MATSSSSKANSSRLKVGGFERSFVTLIMA
ncbi:hypothetical protein CCACVL1_13157 [Corchorus capsularis]|uniref:Uncharacterized protein n=1 Tax=Corchorus capsularis TaxID=210143 RepID=A0A1R3IC01_COCAP|nr:hypothetical protein CCACVL1_13157 [Corchorus capsularis]